MQALKNILFAALFTLTGCAQLMSSIRGEPDEDTHVGDATHRDYLGIALGDSREEVLDAWGEPAQVLTAGQSKSREFEKWLYPMGSFYYSRGPVRVVYFESEHVVGWETLY